MSILDFMAQSFKQNQPVPSSDASQPQQTKSGKDEKEKEKDTKGNKRWKKRDKVQDRMIKDWTKQMTKLKAIVPKHPSK